MGKKSSIDKLAKAAAGLAIAPIVIPVAIASASKKLKAKEEEERIRAGKRYAAEAAKRKREQEKQAKQKARSQAIMEEQRTKLHLARLSLSDRYDECLRNHQMLCHKIDSAVSQNKFEDIILYCEQDIALIPMVYDYFTRKSIIEGVEYKPSPITAYSHLSNAYESVGDYARAILACKDAMDMGITNGMEKRMSQLEQKRRELIVYG